MTRVKNSVVSHNKHKKIIKRASGYYGARSRTYRSAHQAVIKAGQYSYRDRRQKKRLFRRLWIMKINAASRQSGISYSCFMYNLFKSSIHINRKMLAALAQSDIASFLSIINKIKAQLTNVS